MLQVPNAQEIFWPSRIRTTLLTQGHMLAERNLQMLAIFVGPQKLYGISRALLENNTTDILVPTSGTFP